MAEILKDKIIIHRIREGKPEAFGEIYDKYVDAIYRFIFFKVSGKQDAEDLTSQVFTKVLDYCLNKENKIENLRAFLYHVARNLLTDFYRQNSHREIKIDEEILEQSITADQSLWPRNKTIEEEVEIGLDIKKIDTALKKVKEEYREVIVLYYLEEFSVKEIAKVLNKSTGAVRVLIHRALQSLRAILMENELGKMNDKQNEV